MRLKQYLHPSSYIIASVLLSVFLLYLPFMLGLLKWLGDTGHGLSAIYQNFDGVLYIVPAKTGYNPTLIAQLRLESALPAKYYAAHLPLYPIAIRSLSIIFGYLKSMLIVPILFSCVAGVVFYAICTVFSLTKHPVRLTIIMLFLPRLFVLRSVGAPETMFISFVLLSILFFEKKHIFLAGLFGAAAVVTKLPGIILFPAFLACAIEEYWRTKQVKNMLGIILIPLAFFAVCGWYYLQYGDIFAYWHTGGVVPMPYPYSVFNTQAQWVGTAWLEDILLYFFVYGYAVISLWRSRERSFFYFSGLFFIASIFVQHRDLSRYMVPIWPFAAIAFEKMLTSRTFIIIALLLLPAIYLYAWNFIIFNQLPISDWRPYL